MQIKINKNHSLKKSSKNSKKFPQQTKFKILFSYPSDYEDPPLTQVENSALCPLQILI